MVKKLAAGDGRQVTTSTPSPSGRLLRMVVIENTAWPGFTGWKVMSGTSNAPVASEPPGPVRSIVVAMAADWIDDGCTLVPATVTCTVVSNTTDPNTVRRVSDSVAGMVTVQCWLWMVRSVPVSTGLKASAVTLNVRLLASGEAGLKHAVAYCWLPLTTAGGVVVVVVVGAVVDVVLVDEVDVVVLVDEVDVVVVGAVVVVVGAVVVVVVVGAVVVVVVVGAVVVVVVGAVVVVVVVGAVVVVVVGAVVVVVGAVVVVVLVDVVDDEVVVVGAVVVVVGAVVVVVELVDVVVVAGAEMTTAPKPTGAMTGGP